jgi:hypothetical membrane protein
VRRWALASSATAPVALIGGWTLAQTRQPASYDAVTGTISALAARGAHDAWLMTGALAVTGVCHVLTSAGLVEARPAGRAVLAVGGVATALVAVFPQPSAAHFPVATTAFVALAVWPAASGVPSRRRALLASVALLALLGWLGVEIGGGDRLGLSERVLAGAESLWPLATVLAVARPGR